MERALFWELSDSDQDGGYLRTRIDHLSQSGIIKQWDDFSTARKLKRTKGGNRTHVSASTGGPIKLGLKSNIQGVFIVYILCICFSTLILTCESIKLIVAYLNRLVERVVKYARQLCIIAIIIRWSFLFKKWSVTLYTRILEFRVRPYISAFNTFLSRIINFSS